MPCKIICSKNTDKIDNIKMKDNPILSEAVKNTVSNNSILFETVLKNNNKIDHNIDNNFKNSKTNGYKCLICNVVYKHTQSLTNHKKIKHPNYDSELNEININTKNILDTYQLKEIFIKETFEHKQKLEKLIKDLEEKNNQTENITRKSKSNKIINNTTNNMTNNTNNGTIQNINIVQFGRENPNDLTKNEIQKILYEKGVDGLLACLEALHFNDRLPQYKNLRLTNLNSKYIDVHNGITWVKDDKEKIISETLDNHSYNLQVLCDNEAKAKKIKNSVKNFIDNFSKFNNIDTEEKNISDNKKIIKKINEHKDEVKLFMYNKTKNFNNVLDV
jgi:hypothetical protein